MRQRGGHPSGERLVLCRRAARVDPDDVMGQAPEPPHGLAHLARVPDLPSVGDDDDDGAPRDAPTAVLVEEARERRADARAPCPVGSGLRDPGVGVVGSARGELAREAGQSRGEDEGLGAESPDGPAHEMEVDARVGLHRSRHVGDEDDAAGTLGMAALRSMHRIPAGAIGLAERRPDVEARSARVPPEPAAAALRRHEGQLLDESAEQGQFFGRALREVTFGKTLAQAGGGEHRHLLDL